MKLTLPFFSWKAESHTRYVDLGGMRGAGQEPNFLNQFESESDFLKKIPSKLEVAPYALKMWTGWWMDGVGDTP